MFIHGMHVLFVPGMYALSVRDEDDEGKPCVRQYKIKQMDDGSFFITTKQNFASLMELVAHYQG